MTLQELRERHAWSLEQKIDHTLGTIEAFVHKMGGLDKVYISFSGGKDSTVLSHIARILYPIYCTSLSTLATNIPISFASSHSKRRMA